MERRLRRLLLITVLAASDAAAEDAPGRIQIDSSPLTGTDAVGALAPEAPVREIHEADIDAEDFEIGVYGGIISIEDFGTHGVAGASVAYHIVPALFVEANYAVSRLGRTSYELLSGGAELLGDGERDVSYYEFAFGWNTFLGESFIGRRWAFNSAVYFAGGAGVTSFAGSDRFTVAAGAGYRFVVRDWLSLRLDVRDHVFESDLLGRAKTTHNIELRVGASVFF